MTATTAARIMEYGINHGESNHFMSAARELQQKRAKVPTGCTLYLVYGGNPEDATACVWPAMNGDPSQLRMIRRTCRKRRWHCTYYIVDDETINVR